MTLEMSFNIYDHQMKRNTRILLTGASGAVGYEVLKQLHVSKKYDVTAFDIKTPESVKRLSCFSHDVEIIYGDISCENEIKAACIEKDVVIHLAAIIPPLADEQPELANTVNVTGTENLIQSLEKHSPHAFLFYSSSVSVYGDRVTDPNIRVSDPLIPSEGDEYAKTKIAAEKRIMDSQLNWSIFRLSAIMGRHKLSKLMFHQPLNTSLEIATIEDAARAFVHAIEKRTKLSGKIFNLGGGEKCRSSYEDFLKRSFKINGLGKLNFAPKSFADKNFHCGYYQDGGDLENILHFRKDTLDSYFMKEAEKIAPFRKFITSIFRRPIKFYLQKQSEPLKAFKTKDKKAIQHFFICENFSNESTPDSLNLND